MKKAIIIIGQSASGKTTYIKNTYLKDCINISFEDKPFKITKMQKDKDRYLLFGHHKGEKRCEGTDELSMSILPQLIEYITANKDNFDILIAEGDRINNEKFFNFIVSLNMPVELYVMRCSLKESLQRRVETGSNASETFVKTTRTKALRMKEVGRNLGFKVTEVKTGKEKEIEQKSLF